MRRRYRVRVANAGANTVTGNVDFTLALGELLEPPIVTGNITHPLQAYTEQRPFTVRALFPAATIAEMVANDRWTVVGRLVDVAWQDAEDDPDIDPWTTYGVGRISMMSEPDGMGRVELEVSDESWKGRRFGLFNPDSGDLAATANTTQLWPTGIKAYWRGHPAAEAASGTRINSFGDFHLLRLVSRHYKQQHVSTDLDRWVREDTVPKPVTVSAGDETAGNFRRLRVNYAGTDYEVMSFGPAVYTDEYGIGEILLTSAGDLVPEGLGAQVSDPGSFWGAATTLRVWILSQSTPPATGDAYLHAPTAKPSEDTPLHLGLDLATHRWGNSGGWMTIGELTEAFWDAAGINYDTTAMTALKADDTLPALSYVLREEVEDEWAWFEEHIWGPMRHIAVRNSNGEMKLADLRTDADVDPDTLLELNASNTRAHSWQLVGRDAVTQVTFSYLSAYRPVKPEDANALDGFIYTQHDSEPIQADAQALSASGIRNLDVKLAGVLEPSSDFTRTQNVSSGGLGGLFGQVAASLSNDVFDVFQDGAWRMRLEVIGTATIEEGDTCVLNVADIQSVNPATQARTGNRLVRVLSLEEHPTHYVADLIDLGPKLAPLATPTVTLAHNTDRNVVATVAGIPSGAEAVLELTYWTTTSTPTSWSERVNVTADGDTVFTNPPRTGYAHARVRARAANRIRSPWDYATPMPLLIDPEITSFRVEVDADGVPTVYGTPNANTAGVRLRYVLHDAGTVPSFPTEV